MDELCDMTCQACRVGEIAEHRGHHPAILVEWGKVTVSWWTHKIGGLPRNDAIMAASLIYSSTPAWLLNRSPEGLRRERPMALVLRAGLEQTRRSEVRRNFAASYLRQSGYEPACKAWRVIQARTDTLYDQPS